MRRAVVAVASIAFLTVVVLTPVARADDGGWNGTAFNPDPSNATYKTQPTFSGTFVYSHCGPIACTPTRIDVISSHIALHENGALADGCTLPADTYQQYNGDRYNGAAQDFAISPQFSCNGVYDLAVNAHADAPFGGGDGYQLNAPSITIAIPADPPKSVKAVVSGTDIAVSWVGPDAQPPDFLGYQISRYDSLGHETVIVPGPTTSGSLTDKGVGGGKYSYVVRSMRNLAAPSASTKSSTVTVDAPPDPTTDSSSSSSSSSSGSSSSDGTPGSGSTIVLGPTGGGVGGATIVHVPTGKAPSSSGSSGGSSTSSGGGEGVLPDEGFSTDLPYEAEPGQLEAARPSVRTSDDQPGAALLVPGAVASVLFVWAMLIHFVTRQARWADAGLLPLEVEYDG